jgi:hypothetical protein
MEIFGKIIQVLPLQEGISKSTGNPWKVQSYVLETLEQYPRKVCFEIFGEDRINNNSAQLDDLVTVSFDLESREFNGRWYTSVRAWRVQQGDTRSGGENNSGATNNVVQNTPQTNTSQSTVQTPPANGGMGGNTGTFDAAAGDENTDLPF